jgi:DNA-binding LytR/AlgR family response regulator
MLSVPLLQDGPKAKNGPKVSEGDEGSPERTEPALALTEVEKAFWSKVPRELGADVVSLSAEQHYLHVVTTKGRSLILFPISRAIEAVERLNGMRIHRSHWVALKHVTSVEKDEPGLSLTLSSGETLPVSRANRQSVRDALEADTVMRATR